jgi:hypothetical protein
MNKMGNKTMKVTKGPDGGDRYSHHPATLPKPNTGPRKPATRGKNC